MISELARESKEKEWHLLGFDSICGPVHEIFADNVLALRDTKQNGQDGVGAGDLGKRLQRELSLEEDPISANGPDSVQTVKTQQPDKQWHVQNVIQ